ncbi:Cytochrome P450 107B1 [Nocardia otitidiscaviarum]|uniref:Cytochrome P450 107B1 n=1 Tax=Nocardia otitidiscaviarum TaxID=1823 RepID=A0A379JNG6_9NOCA|nr:cytochrome P450 [Nocardia otitidiscaviarum]SUD49563.1 Cytochrome P450 107B1 [Nocardia otitidiscaviarum]
MAPSFHGPRVLLWLEDFAADPHLVYEDMRERYGALAPVELAPGVAATLVIGYHTAVRILNDPDHFPADPRRWQQSVPGDCPVLPMMGWRPNPIRSAGDEHRRYRSAATAALDRIDLHALRGVVEKIAVEQINGFCAHGSADVVRQYAFPVVFGTLNAVLGCSPEISERAATGLAAMFAADADATEGNQILGAALLDLIAAKRATPGADVTSWLIQHPVALDDNEVLHQLVLLYAAGISPPQHLIATTLLLMLTANRFGGELLSGTLSTRDAIDEVLFNDPPMANYCITYPRQPVLVDDVWLPAHQPVVISMAACNNDPAIRSGAEQVTGNRAHLAFSLGPHACPARSMGYMIAQEAIDQLLDALPDLALAVPLEELTWQPGPFHRALEALPVTFPPSSPIP